MIIYALMLQWGRMHPVQFREIARGLNSLYQTEHACTQNLLFTHFP